MMFKRLLLLLAICFIPHIASAATSYPLVVQSVTGTAPNISSVNWGSTSFLETIGYANPRDASGVALWVQGGCSSANVGTCVQDAGGNFWSLSYNQPTNVSQWGCVTQQFSGTDCHTQINNAFTTSDAVVGGTVGIALKMPQNGAVPITSSISLVDGSGLIGDCAAPTLMTSSPLLAGPNMLVGTSAVGGYMITTTAPGGGFNFRYGIGVKCVNLTNNGSFTNLGGIDLNGRLGDMEDLAVNYVGETAINIRGNESWLSKCYCQGLADYSSSAPPGALIGVIQLPKSNTYTYANEINGSQSTLTSSNAFAVGVYDLGGANTNIGDVTEFVDTGYYLNGTASIEIGDLSGPTNGSGFIVGSLGTGITLIDTGVGASCSGGTFSAYNVTGKGVRGMGIAEWGSAAGVVDAACAHGLTDTTTGTGAARNVYDCLSTVGMLNNTKFSVAASGGAAIQTCHGDALAISMSGSINLDSGAANGLNDILNIDSTADGSSNACTFTGGAPGMDLYADLGINHCAGVYGPGYYHLYNEHGTWQPVSAPDAGLSANCSSLPVGAGTVFCPISGFAASNATIGLVQVGTAEGYPARKFTVTMNAAPGASNSEAFTVMNGASATALTCTISGAATSCSIYLSFASAVLITPGNSFLSVRDVVTVGGAATPATQALIGFGP